VSRFIAVLAVVATVLCVYVYNMPTSKPQPSPALSAKEKESVDAVIASASKIGAVAKTETRAVALKGSLAQRQAAAGQERRGFENVAAKDYAIPFIKIVDKSSGVAIKGGDQYIEGCEPGMIFDTVTKEVWMVKRMASGSFPAASSQSSLNTIPLSLGRGSLLNTPAPLTSSLAVSSTMTAGCFYPMATASSTPTTTTS